MQNPDGSDSKINNLFLKNIYRYIFKLKNRFKISRPRLFFPLEIQLADHCNLNCVGCTHYSPIAEKGFIKAKDLIKPLKILSRYQRFFEDIRLLGGEPLLNPECVQIVKTVREIFPNLRIQLVTNGLLLLNKEVCTEEFWATLRECDIEISVTRYPIGMNYDEIEKICESKKIKLHSYGSSLDSDGCKDFNLYQLDRNKNNNRLNFYKCDQSQYYQLVGNKLFTCAQCAYSDMLNKKFGTDFKITKKDYLDVYNMNWLKFLLFQNLPKPFCRYCTFPVIQVKWSKSKGEMSEWVKENET